MTADDFLTRCQEIGVPKLDGIQVQCILRVLGKQVLSNAIRLNELEILMSSLISNKNRHRSNKSKKVLKLRLNQDQLLISQIPNPRENLRKRSKSLSFSTRTLRLNKNSARCSKARNSLTTSQKKYKKQHIFSRSSPREAPATWL